MLRRHTVNSGEKKHVEKAIVPPRFRVSPAPSIAFSMQVEAHQGSSEPRKIED
jgi:hypothetical protein